MPRTINQFMWGYQHVFRTMVESGTSRALEAVGVAMDIRVVLVGFRAVDGPVHGVCVEPENGPLTQAHFASTLERASELLAEDPEQQIITRPQPVPDHRMQGVALKTRAEAVREAIAASGAFPAGEVYVSASSPMGGYEVHTCVVVDAQRIGALPAFEHAEEDRLYVGRSLVHEVIAECLRRADRALYLPEPGAGLNVLGAPTLDVVRAAATRFLDGCAMRTGGMPGDLLEVLEGIVSLEYERSAADGRIVVVGQSRALTVRSVLARAVSLRDSRAIRKLLEVSDEDVALLTDGSKVFGLGDIESRESDDSPAFEIIVPSHATFELRHDGVALMRVAYGRPALPRPLLDRIRFDDVVKRVLAVEDTTILWTIVEAAAGGGHGTIIVVSADAEGEAERLSGQATLLEPAELRADDVTRFSRIDGATLLDVEGRCHAVGVILDGEATGAGDPSRGSRFNSSLRYQASSRTAVVAVVVSDDGYVDLVPDLKPMVKRSDVQAAVEAFRDAATADPVEGERFARTHDSVKAISFYLDQAQCQEVNDLYEHEQDRRLEGGGIAIRESPLRPNPLMNDSYFLEE
ncbi:MAG: hypothetical protein JJLCMIEE_03171 [Acidimicrobiales bacterium]|nr:hypothetical protein [Acidimicrobiales bacterium]RIK04250.1 MAG: hypothetical protein DCC48_14270 [Acidobacteriota bacterium]